MAITPPTLILDNEGTLGWDVTTEPKSTAAFNSAIGDVWVTGAIAEDNAANLDPPTNTGTAQTFTARGAVDTNNWTEVHTYTTIVNAVLTGQTVSMVRQGSALKWNLNVVRFSGSDGIGAVPAGEAETVDTAPSLSITTTSDNSAIVVFIGDWDAEDGTSRTWRTVNGITPTAGNGYELTYFRNASNYAVYIAYYPDAGAAGAKTVGFTAPASPKASIVAIEVKGTTAAVTAAGNAPTQPLGVPFTSPGLRPVARALQLLGDASGQDSKALDDSGAGADTASVAAAVPLTETAAGSDSAFTVAAAIPMADTAVAADGSDLAVTAAIPMADTAVGDDLLTVQIAATISPDQAFPRVPWVAVSPRSASAQTFGDAATPLNNQSVTLDDAGTGTDALIAAAAVPLAETAAGADDVAVAAAIPLTETGAGTDSLSVSVTSGTDAFQAWPQTAWMFTSPRGSSTQPIGDTTSVVALTDTASAADSLTAAPAVPLDDTASATDSLSLAATAAPLSETGTAADDVAISVTLTLADAAAAADSLLVTSDTTSDAYQYASAVPPMAISPRTAAGQIYGDASLGAQPVSLTDSATASDSLAISVTITMADTATAADVMTASIAQPSLSELVSAADALAIAVVLALTETASSTEDLFIGGSGIQGNVYPHPSGGIPGSGQSHAIAGIIGSVR